MRELPAALIRTYVDVPFSLAVLASEMFRSCSRAYCFSKDPAAPRVVARAEKNMVGGLERFVIASDQVFVSVEVIGLNVGPVEDVAGA